MSAGRYGTAGLAHSAADDETARTGVKHRMAFRPRRVGDMWPFVIERV